jgi:hypothetical protein
MQLKDNHFYIDRQGYTVHIWHNPIGNDPHQFLGDNGLRYLPTGKYLDGLVHAFDLIKDILDRPV